jgi:transcriptional regulator with XRE-family HTH domain
MTPEELIERRTRLKLSLRKLAAILDISHNTLWRYERERLKIPVFLYYAMVGLEEDLKRKEEK